MSRRTTDPDAPYLDLDDDVVLLCDPSREGERDEFRRIGRVLDGSTFDDCPRELWGDLEYLARDYRGRLASAPGGGEFLRSIHRGEWS